MRTLRALILAAAVALAACGQTPVFAAPLTTDQRGMVEKIQADARAQRVQLDSALANEVGVHLALLSTQTELKTAGDAVITLRREKSRTERRLLYSRLFGFPLAVVLGIVAGLILSRVGSVAAFLARMAEKIP